MFTFFLIRGQNVTAEKDPSKILHLWEGCFKGMKHTPKFLFSLALSLARSPQTPLQKFCFLIGAGIPIPRRARGFPTSSP